MQTITTIGLDIAKSPPSRAPHRRRDPPPRAVPYPSALTQPLSTADEDADILYAGA